MSMMDIEERQEQLRKDLWNVMEDNCWSLYEFSQKIGCRALTLNNFFKGKPITLKIFFRCKKWLEKYRG